MSEEGKQKKERLHERMQKIQSSNVLKKIKKKTIS